MPSNNAKKESKDQKETQAMKDLSIFDKAAKKVYSFLDNGYQERMIIGAKDQRFRNILNRELEISKGYSHGSIVDFVHSLNLNKNKKDVMKRQTDKHPADVHDLFTRNINDIFGYFQEMYKNRFLEINDLKFISKFIPALGEAVKTTLDSLVASDNIAETVNRKIELAEGISTEDRMAITNEIERIEKETKLLKKLKATVYKKTLITGTYYVYAVPYNKIFAEYQIQKNKHGDILTSRNKNPNTVQRGFMNVKGDRPANESYMLGDIDISDAMEGMKNILKTSELIHKPGNFLRDRDIDERLRTCQRSLPEITYCDYEVLSSAMESIRALDNSNSAMEAFKKKYESNSTKNPYGPVTFDPLNAHPDGTRGTNEVNKKTNVDFNIPGTYIKFIEPKNIIPLRIFDQVIGYYLIHPKSKKKESVDTLVNGVTSIGNSLFSSINIGETKKHDAINTLVNAISDGILKQFDKKFVTDNAEYKKLIADVIVANGLTDKDYNIQFIPADDVIAFTIQEGNDGFGESILSDSLFPAKLLLSMIVTRMLNYINKTGNKTIAHIHKGPINAFDTNQLNRVIRDLQDQDITFNDLLSPNLVFNKFNRDGNMAIPTSKDGSKLIEFETQEGQNIDMNPEYEKNLENMAIMGTSVPSVIMEYIGAAEFAKQIVSANIKFAGRVASLQSDIEEPTTILYKKLIEHSNLTDDQKAICAQSLEIKLPRPRVLVNSNNNDYIQNVTQAAEGIALLMIGQDSSSGNGTLKNAGQVKEKLMYKIAKRNSPFIDWEDYETLFRESILEVTKDNLDNEGQQNNGGGGGQSDDMNF